MFVLPKWVPVNKKNHEMWRETAAWESRGGHGRVGGGREGEEKDVKASHGTK